MTAYTDFVKKHMGSMDKSTPITKRMKLIAEMWNKQKKGGAHHMTKKKDRTVTSKRKSRERGSSKKKTERKARR
jgi:hypothetical protein